MSKTWYPTINLDKCIKCLVCVNFCPNEVYQEKDGRPFVAKPENCPQGCKGCAAKCPVGAIEHVGVIKNEGCSSFSCGCDSGDCC